MSDMELLRQYAKQGSGAAFTELVQRHTNLIYSVALRFVGNFQDAEDVTQAVLLLLAKKAKSLRHRAVLTGWLYETTRLTAKGFMRAKIRRQLREQEAYMQSILDESNSESAWSNLAPHLEDAMARLNEKDRVLILLRFFENKSMAETALLLGIEEWTARKRIQRAVDRLRLFFGGRGIVMPAGAVTSAIAANAIHAAPPALVEKLAAATLTKSATASGSTVTIIKEAWKLTGWTHSKTTVVVATAFFLAVGTATVGVKLASLKRNQVDIQGAWEGVLEPGLGVKFRTVLHVTAVNDSYRATLDNIEARKKHSAISKFIYNYPKVEFEDNRGHFEGTVNASSSEITGTWKQPGLTASVTWKRTEKPDLVPDLLTESDYSPRAGSDLQGYWMGNVHAGPIAQRVAFKIAEPTNGQFVAEMDNLDQGLSNAIVSSVAYAKPKVRMEVGVFGGIFEGNISSDGSKITGVWVQYRNPQPLILERTDLEAAKALRAAEQAETARQEAEMDYSHSGPNDLSGHWKGILGVKGIKLHLALHVAKLQTGGLSGSLDSIDQGANGIAADIVRFTAPRAHLEWNIIGATFDGIIKNGKFSGKWRQAGQEFPVTFERNQP